MGIEQRMELAHMAASSSHMDVIVINQNPTCPNNCDCLNPWRVSLGVYGHIFGDYNQHHNWAWVRTWLYLKAPAYHNVIVLNNASDLSASSHIHTSQHMYTYLESKSLVPASYPRLVEYGDKISVICFDLDSLAEIRINVWAFPSQNNFHSTEYIIFRPWFCNWCFFPLSLMIFHWEHHEFHQTMNTQEHHQWNWNNHRIIYFK